MFLCHVIELILSLITNNVVGKLISEVNVVAMKTAELYCKLERWSEMNLAYKTLLKQEYVTYYVVCGSTSATVGIINYLYYIK